MIEYVPYGEPNMARFFVTETWPQGRVQTWGYPDRRTALEYVNDKTCSTPEPGIWQPKGTKAAREKGASA